MPLVLALFVGAPLSGNMIDRIGVKKVLMFGTLCISLALGLLSLHELEHWNFYTATVILGFGRAGEQVVRIGGDRANLEAVGRVAVPAITAGGAVQELSLIHI